MCFTSGKERFSLRKANTHFSEKTERNTANREMNNPRHDTNSLLHVPLAPAESLKWAFVGERCPLMFSVSIRSHFCTDFSTFPCLLSLSKRLPNYFWISNIFQRIQFAHDGPIREAFQPVMDFNNGYREFRSKHKCEQRFRHLLSNHSNHLLCFQRLSFDKMFSKCDIARNFAQSKVVFAIKFIGIPVYLSGLLTVLIESFPGLFCTRVPVCPSQITSRCFQIIVACEAGEMCSPLGPTFV